MRQVENTSNKEKLDILLNKWFYIIFSFLFFFAAIVSFLWGRNVVVLDRAWSIDSSLFGTFGDFVGGVLGTVFSIISLLLVVKTFIHQQGVTARNIEQMEIQCFNDMFFELLALYQKQVSAMSGKTEGTEYRAKDFFDMEKTKVQNSFRNRNSFEQNRNKALSHYMLFYIENTTKMGAYFRTLYRIYDLIDSSKLDEPIKRDYLKIMRAQLTESELFFIRYNALSYYGENFKEYINKYHILKHLHAFDLLEFKDWWGNLNQVDRTGINIIFSNITRIIRNELYNVVKDKILPPTQEKGGKYKIILNINGGTDVNLRFELYSDEPVQYMELRAFEKFEPKRLQQLLDCFIKELFIYSNFGRYNSPREIETYSSPVRTIAKGHTSIDSGIRNIKGERLKLEYDIDM